MSNAPTSLGIVTSPGQPYRRMKARGEAVANSTMQTMKIFVRGLEIDAHCGVYAHEKGKARKLVLDIEIELGASAVVQNDDLNTTIDYDKLVASAKKIAQAKHYHLIESYASALADEIISDSRISVAIIRVNKPTAIPDAKTTGVEIVLKRG